MAHIKRLFISAVLLSLSVSAHFAFSADSKVIAYYFHGDLRCLTCNKMEQYTKEAIDRDFEEEVAEGTVVFKAINVEEEENRHFTDEYQLYTKTLIISQVEDGKEVRYKNLNKIWEYVMDKERFSDYVTGEINDYLKK
ncbi:nitrophenyl compound nitroreductase subunit ArsF family protein [Candidatus Omnitrophota bacterium]